MKTAFSTASDADPKAAQRGACAASWQELLAQNQIPNTIKQQLDTLDSIGGLEMLGTAKTDNMYHAGWAWAGNTPFRSTKLIAAHFGGIRNPMVVSWPKGIKPDKTPRSQFHHVNDIVPTIYEIVGITPPNVVHGQKQDPIDGISLAYTFASATAPGRKKTQYFENSGSRAIYHDGWFAAAFGPLTPWLTVSPGLETWNPNNDKWELYDLRSDFSQADDLADKEPARLATMKKLFLAEAEKNKVFPIGAGIWLRLHPEDRAKVPYTRWSFDQSITRLPEFAAPPIGTASNHIVMDVDVGENASGVLYALGGISGGVSLYIDKGQLIYEYNMMMIERYIGRSAERLPAGRHKITIDTAIPKPGAPSVVTVSIDGKETIRVDLKRTVPAAFSASETLDVGTDLGSPVSLDYYDRRPFKFGGQIKNMDIELR